MRKSGVLGKSPAKVCATQQSLVSGNVFINHTHQTGKNISTRELELVIIAEDECLDTQSFVRPRKLIVSELISLK